MYQIRYDVPYPAKPKAEVAPRRSAAVPLREMKAGASLFACMDTSDNAKVKAFLANISYTSSRQRKIGKIAKDILFRCLVVKAGQTAQDGTPATPGIWVFAISNQKIDSGAGLGSEAEGASCATEDLVMEPLAA